MFSFDYTKPYSVTIEPNLRDGLNILSNRMNKISNNDNVLAMFRTFGVVGDSYASGEIYYNGTRRDEYTLSWGQILARRNGMICHNYSCGGLTTRSWLTTSYGLPSLLSNEPDDIYFLALGINDYYHEGIDYLGSLSDIQSDYTQNADTFYGNYGKIICKIKEHAPNSKIIIFTVANQNEVPAMFTEAIKKIANHFNIGCIIQSDDEYFTSDFYWNQMIGGHPTALSYSRMSLAFERLINNCIINNIDYFADTLMF
jgi:hypothetical protein